jgi:serine/threonine protein kinase
MYVVAPKRTYFEPIRPITEADVNSFDEVPDSFQQLILRCADVDPKKRFTVSQVVHELENIANQVANCRPCLVCLDQPRYRRCFPFGHKTMCNTCLIQRQQANSMPESILCRQVFTSTQEDADLNTYALPDKHPQ